MPAPSPYLWNEHGVCTNPDIFRVEKYSCYFEISLAATDDGWAAGYSIGTGKCHFDHGSIGISAPCAKGNPCASPGRCIASAIRIASQYFRFNCPAVKDAAKFITWLTGPTVQSQLYHFTQTMKNKPIPSTTSLHLATAPLSPASPACCGSAAPSSPSVSPKIDPAQPVSNLKSQISELSLLELRDGPASRIVHRSPLVLRPHDYIARLHRWSHDDPDFRAFLDDIRSHGIQVPLQITAADFVCDGEMRRQAAALLHLATVPCIIVPDDQASAIAISSLTQRRHYTKSALAYLAIPLLESQIEAARQNQTAALKSGANVPFAQLTKTIAQMAEEIGVHRMTFTDACKVRELFLQDPEYRAQIEPRLLSGEVGLGAIIAGAAGRAATKDKARAADQPLILWDRAMKDWRNRYRFWAEFDDAQKLEAMKSISSAIWDMPEDLLTRLQKQVSLELKRRAI